MVIGIRQKLMLGLGGLVAIVILIGALTMVQIDQLAKSIDIILRENYRSVMASQDMKEALERMDSGLLFSFAGKPLEGNRLIEDNRTRFLASLNAALGNITLPGEGEKAGRIQELFQKFTTDIPKVTNASLPLEERHAAYFSTLLPLFQEIKMLAQEILDMNQANMSETNDAARRQAASAHRRMLTAIIACIFIAALLSYMARRWILKPIQRLIESTNEIRRGNLDLVLETGSQDEIGRLSESFNEMAAALRQVRKSNRMSLQRTRRATEEVFRALPEAVALLDMDGRIEVSTETAEHHFGLKRGLYMRDLCYEWLPKLVMSAIEKGHTVELDEKGGIIQKFIENREHFFQPLAIPIPVRPGLGEPAGTALILRDVTQAREQQELKRSVVSIVSHQLRTPLSSLLMSIHLLLEEKIGTLNEKQVELLMAAREDTDRLVTILDDLLDLSRIESGKTQLKTEPVSPRALARHAVEPFLAEAKDKGIAIVNAVPEDLPDVMAEPTRLYHVFANLLSNAFRFTNPGGTVTIRGALSESGFVQFSVEDTGSGIPADHLSHLFEQFYRVPGQKDQSGIGLGLAIVKEIVKTHSGEVGAESEVGKGSVFHFTLPLALTGRNEE
ncbi:MAG: HAMP domain-containing histidine kinase [Deltaproteobacteria bacterium HGW-Deltaproteobacteria-21]|nr:MAG: HAMP domain-containing histidine kinase [Deltaproteobacteria bacterium HGW-Deltaproteobacteria-21]